MSDNSKSNEMENMFNSYSDIKNIDHFIEHQSTVHVRKLNHSNHRNLKIKRFVKHKMKIQ